MTDTSMISKLNISTIDLSHHTNLSSMSIYDSEFTSLRLPHQLKSLAICNCRINGELVLPESLVDIEIKIGCTVADLSNDISILAN